MTRDTRETSVEHWDDCTIRFLRHCTVARLAGQGVSPGPGRSLRSAVGSVLSFVRLFVRPSMEIDDCHAVTRRGGSGGPAYKPWRPADTARPRRETDCDRAHHPYNRVSVRHDSRTKMAAVDDPVPALDAEDRQDVRVCACTIARAYIITAV